MQSFVIGPFFLLYFFNIANIPQPGIITKSVHGRQSVQFTSVLRKGDQIKVGLLNCSLDTLKVKLNIEGRKCFSKFPNELLATEEKQNKKFVVLKNYNTTHQGGDAKCGKLFQINKNLLQLEDSISIVKHPTYEQSSNPTATAPSNGIYDVSVTLSNLNYSQNVTVFFSVQNNKEFVSYPYRYIHLTVIIFYICLLLANFYLIHIKVKMNLITFFSFIETLQLVLHLLIFFDYQYVSKNGLNHTLLDILVIIQSSICCGFMRFFLLIFCSGFGLTKISSKHIFQCLFLCLIYASSAASFQILYRFYSNPYYQPLIKIFFIFSAICNFFIISSCFKMSSKGINASRSQLIQYNRFLQLLKLLLFILFIWSTCLIITQFDPCSLWIQMNVCWISNLIWNLLEVLLIFFTIYIFVYPPNVFFKPSLFPVLDR